MTYYVMKLSIYAWLDRLVAPFFQWKNLQDIKLLNVNHIFHHSIVNQDNEHLHDETHQYLMIMLFDHLTTSNRMISLSLSH